MKKNVGTTDKLIRLIVAAIVAILYLTGMIKGTVGIILLMIAAVLAVTALVNRCGIYAIFGMSSCPKE